MINRLSFMLFCVVASGLFSDEVLVEQETSSAATLAAKTTSEAEDGTAAAAVAEVARPEDSTQSQRWLLLCCGLPGDDDHRTRMTDACRKIMAASEPILGVASSRLHFLAGDDVMHSELSKMSPQSDICTTESVQGRLKELTASIPAKDSCWVICIGHAQLYGARSQYNVMDEDFDQKQFSEWAASLACQEQVFWMTTPVSGFWVRPLKNDKRVVISATEADLEFTGTEMPYALADVLADEAEHTSLTDIDQDGNTSLLDLYLATNLEIDGRFKSLERLQTEHAQLDDNGDGRGSELQLAYLPPEEDEDDEEDDDETDESEDGDDSEEEDDASTAESDAEDETQSVQEKPEMVSVPKPISSPNLDGYRSRFVLIKEAAE